MPFFARAQEKVFLYPDNKEKDAPFIESFPSKNSNGITILVCPGGGYTHLAVDHEGKDIAKFYNQNGFDAWVLHYRLNDGEQKGHRFPDQYNDVTTALRIVKSKAKNADKVGIIGFSAGGHLASMGTTMHLDAENGSTDPLNRYNTRPAFSMLIYPVIDMSGGKVSHAGSRTMLLGKDPDPKLADSLSTQNRVNEKTPPTFIVFSTDDDVVPVENGILFYEALHKHNILASLHIYDHGGHGYGMAPDDPVVGTWPKLSVDWIRSLKLK
ncbi:MAG: alpha/beta hydrolase [Bacteroidota bacterium]